MKLIFFGTPEYVIPIPEVLKKAGHEIVAVVTQPPKPVGRKKILTPSPVAQWATKHNIPVLTDYTPIHMSVWKVDVGILAAYGRIIPKEVIDYFPHGILNVHPSLLPQYRGASPVQAAILNGDKETGVTIIKLDEEVDHGPIINQLRDRVRVSDTSGTLRERLFKKAAGALPALLDNYLNGKITPKAQDHKKATFTTLIKKSGGFVKPQDVAAALQGLQVFDSEDFDGELSRTVAQTRGGVPLQTQQLECFIRAMQPWPGAHTKLKMKNEKVKILKLTEAHMEENQLVLDQVQLEGKKPVSWTQFKEGYPEAKF